MKNGLIIPFFIITADHGSQPGFDEYRKTVNRTGIPILIYKPDNSLREVKKRLSSTNRYLSNYY